MIHQLFRLDRMWARKPLRDRYDVVIVGAGAHGLAIAYHLAKDHGVRDVALLDKGWLGGGASGRNTAIIRSNYRTPEAVPFYEESVRLYEALSRELNYNVMFSQHGHLTLAHTDLAVKTLRERAEVNRLHGVDSRIIGPGDIHALAPALDVGRTARHPIQAALYHPPGGIIRHDAVVWGYARAVDRMGVEIHPFTEATGIEVAGGAVAAVETPRGRVKAGAVVNATAGWATLVARMAGVELPITTHPLQALVTEPLKPFLDPVIVSATLHVYVNQTDRGELVIGEEINPYTSYSSRSTLEFLENAASHALELFPCLHGVRVLRQWAGICDMTPDFSPILGAVEGVKGFFLDVGWGTYGFKAAPVSGKRVAELIATGRTPPLIAPFALSRFAEGRLVGEKAAAAVSH